MIARRRWVTQAIGIRELCCEGHRAFLTCSWFEIKQCRSWILLFQCNLMPWRAALFLFGCHKSDCPEKHAHCLWSMRKKIVAKSEGSWHGGWFHAPQHTLLTLALDCVQELCCCIDYYWPKFPLGSFPSASLVAGLHRLIIEAKKWEAGPLSYFCNMHFQNWTTAESR